MKRLVQHPLWRRGGFFLVGLLYLLLTVNAATCNVEHTGPGSAGAAAHSDMGSHDGSGRHNGAEHHGGMGNAAHAVCKCVGKLVSSGAPKPLSLSKFAYVVRVARLTPPSMVARSTASLPAPRGPPFSLA